MAEDKSLTIPCIALQKYQGNTCYNCVATVAMQNSGRMCRSDQQHGDG